VIAGLEIAAAHVKGVGDALAVSSLDEAEKQSLALEAMIVDLEKLVWPDAAPVTEGEEIVVPSVPFEFPAFPSDIGSTTSTGTPVFDSERGESVEVTSTTTVTSTPPVAISEVIE
jgi:hypothetical protein